MNTAVAVGALERARELVGQLDWSRTTEELNRAQAGIKHELETALAQLALEAQASAALTVPGFAFPAEVAASWEASVGLVRNDHPETAQEAAKAIKLRSGTQRASVLLELLQADLKTWHGMSDEDLQRTLRMGASSERPRRVELVRMGFVVDSGKRAPTTSGMDAILWTITEAGRAAARKLEIQDPLPFEAAIREAQRWQDAEEAQVPEVTGSAEDLAQVRHLRFGDAPA